MDTSVGSLFDLNLVGNDIISGGIFRPEAGLVATVVLLLGIFILYFLGKKSNSNFLR